MPLLKKNSVRILADDFQVVAVIPFYNEAAYLKSIIEETQKYVDLIILVNDGSTDDWLESTKFFSGVILHNECNIGKGAALNKGFLKSIELKSQFTITLDADLQHPPSSIPDFLHCIKDFDIVIGNRNMLDVSMPIQRKLSNFLTSKLLSIKTKYDIKDSQSGFRIYRTQVLNSILPSSNGFEAESEIIVNASRQKLKLGFTQIPTIYGEEKSKMKAFSAIKGFLKVLFFR